MKGKAFSVDLRERVVAAVRQQGLEWAEAAELFGVGVASVGRWIRLAKEKGSLAPRPKGHRRAAVSGDGVAVMRGLVEEKPDRTLAELAALYTERTGVKLSTSSTFRALRRLGLTLKKKRSVRSSAIAKTSKRRSGATRRPSAPSILQTSSSSTSLARRSR